MEYLGNLVIIGMYFMIEVKFDEQIRAVIAQAGARSKFASQLMHSFWQNAGRFILMFAILFNQPMPSDYNEAWQIILATSTMYGTWYWWGFDSVFAAGVLKQKAWFLGTTAIPDKWIPKILHLPVWVLKLAAFSASVYWVLKIS